MTALIALFNHKGGVSKTTTTFNLGWALAVQGKRVLIVDADPQCNLTGTALGLNDNAAARPVFSPDGRRVAFLCSREGTWHICVIDVDGSNEQQITRHPAVAIGPMFSPR